MFNFFKMIFSPITAILDFITKYFKTIVFLTIMYFIIVPADENLVDNNRLSLKKPLKPYIVRVQNISRISIDSNAGNTWYPSVIFYDNDFNIIEIHEDESLQKSLRISVPKNTKYIKIDDLYTLANLKRGINITKD